MNLWPPSPFVIYGTLAFIAVCLLLWIREKSIQNPPESEEAPLDESGNKLEYVDLVDVFSTTDINQAMFVKSLLGGSGIKYVSQGETYMGRRRLPIHILVPADQADDARALIKEL
jgi:hypothetical protein